MKKNEEIKILARSIYEVVKDKKDTELAKVVDNFIIYLKQKGLMRMIPDILSQLESLYLEDKHMLKLNIFSKFELAADEVQVISRLVEKKSGKRVKLEKRLDEEILGGARLRYEDKIIDFSLKTQINNLAKELSN